MPRRRKSMRPLRAIAGSASPSPAMRSTSYWAAMAGDGIEHASVVACSSDRFFLFSLACPWMDFDAELVADYPRKLPSANRLAWDQPSLQERKDLAVDLVGA